jgi:hypothetical protein
MDTAAADCRFRAEYDSKMILNGLIKVIFG